MGSDRHGGAITPVSGGGVAEKAGTIKANKTKGSTIYILYYPGFWPTSYRHSKVQFDSAFYRIAQDGSGF